YRGPRSIKETSVRRFKLARAARPGQPTNQPGRSQFPGSAKTHRNAQSTPPRFGGSIPAGSANFRITLSGERAACTFAALAVHNPDQIGTIRAWKRAFGSSVDAAARR